MFGAQCCFASTEPPTDAQLDAIIAARLREQAERLAAALARGRQGEAAVDGGGGESAEEAEEMDPFLDQLKADYSQRTHDRALASGGAGGGRNGTAAVPLAAGPPPAPTDSVEAERAVENMVSSQW